ncbi:tRNA 2-thiouridine(34) synthase MnmA [Patescibacteria group bacterium]|jgi:tRNA-specific 2-thiouridylase|nr:tRNA 2-thiouridine(34) synthase MnmA [Patescibacteria group bacterium]
MNIWVGLSGGVDSSTSLYLLKEAGHDVTACFISVWQPDFLPCTQNEDRRDALRVAAHLDVPFRDIDARDAYKARVVDHLVHEYQEGRTPNPDVMCNDHIKFGLFFDAARAAGAEAVATGHYARRAERADGSVDLLSGVDSEKDQSYFLWRLTQEKLQRIRFPVGEYEKAHVRELAARAQLPTAHKRDSQGLCFMGHVDLEQFLIELVGPQNEGQVLDTAGHPIGSHPGALFFTIGQRHGFSVAAHGPHTPPLYVISKDTSANTLTVAPKHEMPATDEVTLTTCNWINHVPEIGTTYQARFRYRQRLFDVSVIAVTDTGATIALDEPQVGVPAGQSLVLYDGEVCMGGGIIQSTSARV